MLTVLVSTVSNSENKCECKSSSHFSAKILVYMAYDIVSFEQLGHDGKTWFLAEKSNRGQGCIAYIPFRSWHSSDGLAMSPEYPMNVFNTSAANITIFDVDIWSLSPSGLHQQTIDWWYVSYPPPPQKKCFDVSCQLSSQELTKLILS